MSRIPVVVAPMHVNGTCVAREMAKKGARVIGVDSSADAVGFRSRFVKERHVIVPPQEKSGPFASFLLARKDLYGGIVIPTDDFFVRDVADHFDSLKDAFRLAVSPPPSTHIALDKSLTYEACDRGGIDVPRRRQLDESADIDEACEFVGFPAIMRPAFSIGFYREFGTKSFVVESAGQVKELLPRTRPGGHKMMLQEVIPGDEEMVVSCKTYVTDSRVILGVVPGFKLAIYPPKFGVGQVQESRRAPQLVEKTKAVLRLIDFRGSVAAVEFKFDGRDGKWKLLEINARTLMSIDLLKLAGLDVLEMLWRDKLGLPQLGPAKIRYDRRTAYIKNGLLLYRKYPEERKGIIEYLKRYRPPIRFALLDLTDLRPFLYDIAPLFKRRFRGG